MNLPDGSRRGSNVSTVSNDPLNSNIECDSVHGCTLAVQTTSFGPSQNAIASPYHCGTFCTCVRPMRNCRRKFAAVPESSCTCDGVIVSWKLPAPDACDHQRP